MKATAHKELTDEQIQRVNRTFFPERETVELPTDKSHPWKATATVTARSVYPATEARVEEAAILHGAEGKNYSRRRSTPGSTRIADARFFTSDTLEDFLKQRNELLARLARIPRRPQNAARISRLAAKIAKYEVIPGKVEHHKLALWEKGLVDLHDSARIHEADRPAKRIWTNQLYDTKAPHKSRKRFIPAWLVQEIDALPKKRERKPKVAYTLAQRDAEIAARAKKPKKAKKPTWLQFFAAQIYDVARDHHLVPVAIPAPVRAELAAARALAEAFAFDGPPCALPMPYEVRLCLPAPAPEPEKPSPLTVAREKIAALLADFD